MNAPDRSILLIEDNQEDFEATLRALKTNGITVPVFRCDNGDDGLDFIYQRGVFANPLLAPRPSIILLDLNLPGTDGREVLSSVKNDEVAEDRSHRGTNHFSGSARYRAMLLHGREQFYYEGRELQRLLSDNSAAP